MSFRFWNSTLMESETRLLPIAPTLGPPQGRCKSSPESHRPQCTAPMH